MDSFLAHLVSFNPYWLGGAILFGYFSGKIMQRSILLFALLGYVLFVFPTIWMEKLLYTSRVGSEILQVGRGWLLSPFDMASLLVASTAVLISCLFWALNH